MNYAQRIEINANKPIPMTFAKLAEEKSKKSLLKDVALVGGGTALGAGLGYGTAALMNKRYGKTTAGMSPSKRLKVMVPIAAGAGGLTALTHVLRQRADVRKKGE